ncbi:MAG: hypothetical protein IK079_05185 [Desulfovibrio sp.]|nr:hypothetical protein [Desulfovibrio sp.]
MNTLIDFKALAKELAALEKQGKGHGEDLLIARVLHNMSPVRWKEFCQAYPASNWGALPVSSLSLDQIADDDHSGYLLGDELKHAIGAEKFIEQLDRELVRMGRVGGELSLLCADVVGINQPCAQENQEIMVRVLRAKIEACDSIATNKDGQPLMLLPGTGPVRSRHMAETLQKNYQSQRTENDASHLALGLLSIDLTEKSSAQELVNKVTNALHTAQKTPPYLFQIGPEALNERSTLVHSDEKRFLFYGGM